MAKENKQRKVKGICDTYLVEEVTDAAKGGKFLEVKRLVPGNYEEEPESYEWLCDIDGTLADTDEYILNEIYAATDR